MSQFRHTPAEARKLWVEALRSETKQSPGVLCELNYDGEPIGWCCLGIACEVFSQYEAHLPSTTSVLNGRPVRTYDSEKEVPPQPVMQWLGLRTHNGDFKELGTSKCLTELNDDGLSFKSIADIIESSPPGLFKEAVDA